MNCLNSRPSSRIDNKNHFLIQTTKNSTQATKIVSHPYICVDQGVLQDSVFTDCPYPRPREPWWFYPSNLRDSPGFARHLFQGKADGSGIPSTPTPPPLFLFSLTENYIISNWKLKVSKRSVKICPTSSGFQMHYCNWYLFLVIGNYKSRNYNSGIP